ncbi:MAG TPA: hypothetical protein VF988_15595 [Verrucomicrobiae bacterium]
MDKAVFREEAESERSSMKRTLFLICGICWLGFGAGFMLLLVKCFMESGGLPNSGFANFFGDVISPGSVAVGVVQVVGLLALAIVSFGVGINLCIRSKSKR